MLKWHNLLMTHTTAEKKQEIKKSSENSLLQKMTSLFARSKPQKSDAKDFTDKMQRTHWNDVDKVRLVIAAKQKARNQRGEAFNCFVLPYSPYNSLSKPNPFEEFFTHLEKNIHTFTGETRFQLVVPMGVVGVAGYHWTTLDVLVKDGELSVFSLDAAGDSNSQDALDYIMEKFPRCNAYRVEHDLLPGSKEGRRKLIQTDNESCSRMALEHAFLLSKRNIFPDLAKGKLQTEAEHYKENEALHKDKFSFVADRSKSTIKLVRSTDLLSVAPACYRVTQSWKTLASFKDDPIVSGKGLTLHEYADRHSATMAVKGGTTKINGSIAYKKERFLQRASQFCEEAGEAGIKAALEQSKQAPLAFVKASAPERQQMLLAQAQNFSVKTQVSAIFNKIMKNNTATIEQLEKRYRDFCKKSPSKEQQQQARQQKKADKKLLREMNLELTDTLKKINTLLDKVPEQEQPQHLLTILALDMPSKAKEALSNLHARYQTTESPRQVKEEKQNPQSAIPESLSTFRSATSSQSAILSTLGVTKETVDLSPPAGEIPLISTLASVATVSKPSILPTESVETSHEENRSMCFAY